MDEGRYADDAAQTVELTLEINGEEYRGVVEPRLSLLDLIRESGRTGTHAGCEHGVCGACTVLLDGLPVRSCLVLAVQAHACSVETVEGLGTELEPHPLQRAFSVERALQCGFCTPGFLMVGEGLARECPRPDEARVREAVSSNICRCTGYEAIVRAFMRAAAERAEPDGSDPGADTP